MKKRKMEIYREIEYKGEKIPYILKKDKIKNLYIHIKDGKVIVKSPIRLKEEYINKFIKEKEKWIYEKILESNKKTILKEDISKEETDKLANIIQEIVERYEQKLKVKPNKVRIRYLNYAWGSCSKNKNISINQKLAKKDKKTIEYVVLHEMCHLIYMNHSKDFWNLVKENMPEYKIYNQKLKN